MAPWTPADDFHVCVLVASLLYFYVSVVSEASACMTAYGRSASIPTSGFGGAGNSKDDEVLSRKRKYDESLHSCYYAQPKVCFDVASNDCSYPDIQYYKHQLGNFMPQNRIPNDLGVEETNTVILHSSFAQGSADGGASSTWDESTADGFRQTTIQRQEADSFPAENQFLVGYGSSIPAESGIPENYDDLNEEYLYALLFYDNVANSNHATGLDAFGKYSLFGSKTPCLELGNKTATASSEGYSDKTVNIAEPFYMDFDSINTMDDSYIDDQSSRWPDHPNIDDQDQMPDVAYEMVTSETEEVNEVAGSCTMDWPESCNSEVPTPSFVSTSSASQFPELTNGIICCTLNSEDPEIPCNDDVFFPAQSFEGSSKR